MVIYKKKKREKEKERVFGWRGEVVVVTATVEVAQNVADVEIEVIVAIEFFVSDRQREERKIFEFGPVAK